MKYSLIIMFCFQCVGLFSQHDSKYQLLDEFIKMHNQGTEEAIEQFIEQAYLPGLVDDNNLDKHIAFYQHIIEEFGPLNQQIYKTDEESALKLIVQLIKRHEHISNPAIDPADILQVELDVSEDSPTYLSRGLGLGALICAKEKR